MSSYLSILLLRRSSGGFLVWRRRAAPIWPRSSRAAATRWEGPEARGGFTLLGRASAIYNILENEQATDTIRNSLADGGVFNRENNGYLLTFSGLGGGTGSGIVPIVTEWMQRNLQPPPTTTFSLCVLPEGRGDVTSGAEWGEPRLLSNLLTSLYYLAQTPSVNGVMLADNLLMEELGHPDFIGKEGINRYLQDVLMPLFLSAQTTYHFNPFGTQLDAANVRTTLSPKGDGLHEFIAAGFSIFPLRNAPERIRRMTGNIVEAGPVDGMPTLSDMLHKALEATVVECQPNTARNALALMAGPERYLRRVVKDNRQRGRFEEELRGLPGQLQLLVRLRAFLHGQLPPDDRHSAYGAAGRTRASRR